MPWRQITLTLSAADLERAEALLRLAGAAAITLADDGDDPVLEPPPGTIAVWPRVRLTALFEAAPNLNAVIELVTATTEVDDITTSVIHDADWRAGWEQSIVPIYVADTLTIVPADYELETPADTTVKLGMGLAFGTGRHPTTRLCLEWIAENDVSGREVFDFGCGSGVLALAALCRGARSAVATDNDEQALIATRENARLNNQLDKIRVVPVHELGDDFRPDLTFANILAGTLVEHEKMLAQLQRTGGDLIVSGVLPSQSDDVISAFRNDYQDFTVKELDGWLLIGAKRI